MYPKNDHTADVYLPSMDYTQLDRLERLTVKFKEMEEEEGGSILRGSDNWWVTMKEFAMEKKNITSW